MKINIKYIWVLFAFVLFSLILFQGVWLYNTYSISRDELGNKINGILTKSIEKEVGMRYARFAEKNESIVQDSTLVYNFEFDETEIESQGMISQQMYAMQSLLVYDGFTFELSALDSIFVDYLKKDNINTNYLIQYRDSGGIIKTSGSDVSKNAFFTDVYLIVDETTVQALVDIPIPVVLKQNMFILIVSLALFLLLIICLLYVLRVVFTQDSLLRLRDDFTNALNHNMRTPLSSVHTAIEIWSSGRLDNDIENRNKTVSVALKQVDYLLSIVDTILSISRYEHNRIALDKAELNIPEIIEGLKGKYSLPYRNKTVKITTDYNVSKPVFADEVHLISVIENLIENAIKYSGSNVDIHVCCYIQKDRLYIKVKDNGYGISKKAMPRIFDKFERCDAVKRNEAKGFGLGLNYVKNIVNAHGGIVSVKSTEGLGSEFEVDIPIK